MPNIENTDLYYNLVYAIPDLIHRRGKEGAAYEIVHELFEFAERIDQSTAWDRLRKKADEWAWKPE